MRQHKTTKQSSHMRRRTYPFLLMLTSTLTILLLSALTSCLSESPRSAIEEDKAYTSASSLELATIASLYNYIGGNVDSQGLQGTYRGVYDLNTFTTDEAMLPTRGGDWYDGGFWQNLYLHKWTSADDALYDTWVYLYKVVVFCNRHLETLAANKSLLSQNQYDMYVAEIRAIRAMFYFYIMDLWGSVPVVTSTSQDMKTIGKTQRSEVFTFIIKELQEAINDLPDIKSNLQGEYYGRMTRPVAFFLLAKLFLNAEVYTDNDWTNNVRNDGKNMRFDIDGTQMNAWQACIYFCNQLEYRYKLEENYAENFTVHNENSSENIFTIPMDKYLYANQFKYLFRSRHYAHGATLGMAAENGSVATISTVKAFGYGMKGEEPDDRFYLNFYSDTLYIDGHIVSLTDGKPLVYQPLEVRLDLTGSPYEKTAGARMRKYETDKTAYADGNLQDNDIVLFRFADVLLMRAEARFRNGEDGLTDINAVRKRAGAKVLTSLSLDAILKERLLELVWEGWRRNDLIRFGLFHKAYDQRTPTDEELTSQSTIVFPIPDKAIDLNNNLK